MPATPGVLRRRHSISRGSKWIEVRWTADSAADAAQLQRRKSGTTTFFNVAGATASPFRDTVGVSPNTSYDYRVQYVDVGNSNTLIYSNTLTVRSLPMRPDNPTLPVISGALVDQWDAGTITGKATNDAVTSFTSLKGNILTGTATYSATGMNGRPCLLFNGTSNIMKLVGLNYAQPFTIFIVAKTNTNKDSNALFSGGGSSDWNLLSTTAGLTANGVAINGAGTTWLGGSDNANSGSMAIGPFPPTIFGGLGLPSNGSSTARAFINGFWAVNYGGGAFNTNGITDFQIGKSRNTAGTFLDGAVAEVLVYNRELTGLEFDSVIGYLSDKYDTPQENIALGPPRRTYAFYTSAGENAREALSVVESEDGVAFYRTKRVKSPLQPCRDPSPMVRGGTLYLTHSPTSLHAMPNSSYNDRVPILKSTDGGYEFSLLGYWNLASIMSVPGGANNVWAPDFLQDDNGKLYIYATVYDNQAAAVFRIAEITSLEPLTIGASQLVTGDVQSIDLCIRKKNGVYVAVYGSGPVYLATASSPAGPYTQQSQLLSGSGNVSAEGPFIADDDRFESTGVLRVYYSSLNATKFVQAYKESSDFGATWGAEVFTTNEEYAFAHGGMILRSKIQTSEFGAKYASPDDLDSNEQIVSSSGYLEVVRFKLDQFDRAIAIQVDVGDAPLERFKIELASRNLGSKVTVGEVTASANDFTGTGPLGKIKYCISTNPRAVINGSFNMAIALDGEAELIVSAESLSSPVIRVRASGKRAVN